MTAVLNNFGDAIRNLQTDENSQLPESDIELVYQLLGGDKTFSDNESESKSEKKPKQGKKSKEKFAETKSVTKSPILKDLKKSVIIVAMIFLLSSSTVTNLLQKVSPKPMVSKIIFYALLVVLTFLVMRVL